MRYEYAFLQQRAGVHWIASNIHDMLAEFRAARDKDAQVCFKNWGSRMEHAERAMRNTTGVAQLEADKANPKPELLVKSCFREVGDMLEGSLQPFVRLRLGMHEVAGKRKRNAPAVASMTFGQVITELAESAGRGDIYRPLALGLPVSQWRNIANHNGYEVFGSEVVCSYGVPGKISTLCVPIPIILDLTRHVNDLCFVHKIAYEFFSVDNLLEIRDQAPAVEITEATIDGSLAFGLVSSGFTIVKVGQNASQVALGLIDTKMRSEHETKGTLQEAVLTYALLAGPIEVAAIVRSGNTDYCFSFRIAIPRNQGEMPAGFNQIRRLDGNYGLGPPESLVGD